MEDKDTYKNFRFDKFQPETEQWDYYLQRFELELEINELMTDANAQVRRNLLLSKVGPHVFKILADHFKPAKPTSKSYIELIAVLNRFYGKKVYIFAERINFASCFRKDNETVIEYVNRLRAVAGDCSFGTGLGERMRDQLIFGINNREWQENIIQKHPTNQTTLEEVEATAVILEQASIQTKQLTFLHTNFQSDNHVNRVNKQTKKRVTSNSETKPATFTKRNSKIRELHSDIDCLYCGDSKHRQKNCPAFGKICSSCGEENHFSRVCVISGNAVIRQTSRTLKYGGSSKRSTRCVQDQIDQGCDDFSDSNDESDSDDKDRDPTVMNIRKVGSSSKILLSVGINQYNIEMLYDPGSVHAVIGKTVWNELGKPMLTKTDNLIAYGNTQIKTLGKLNVEVNAFDKKLNLPLYVTDDDDIPLFGLDWVLAFKLPLPPGAKVCHVKSNFIVVKNKGEEVIKKTVIDEVLRDFPDLFEEHLGTIKGHQAKIHINDDVMPKRFRPRSVPLALQDHVSAELDRLVRDGVLEPVDTTNTPILWSSPIVVAMKSNGKLRICADFKVTINKYVQIDDYPLPRFEDITAKLSGGKYFSKIDLKDAYLQLEVHPDSRKYLVIATHKGYFAYKRLPFGISFAPSLFQRIMDQILSGIEGVVCYLDDILITAPNFLLHSERLREVLRRLQASGIKTQKSKCDWLRSSITYLGHKIDAEGLHPTEDRIEAIKQMPVPKNTTQLRSFLGTITYYGRFIENLHVTCVPLHRHLKKNAKWDWSNEDTEIFENLKKTLTSTDTLIHYDPNKILVVSSDASNVGTGAVLSHKFPDGTLKPIAFASRSFSDVEKRYSTIDKEAAGLVYAVTKFHQYLYGRRFTLITDHKPLERIFGEDRQTPKIASNRLLRWAMTLNSYNFNVEYLPGKENCPADSLSRLPLCSPTDFLGLPNHAQLLHLRIRKLPMGKQLLKKETQNDKTLSTVINYIQSYWPDKEILDDSLKPYYEKRSELSFEEDTLLWKGRVCIPAVLQEEVLAMLHDGHPGVTAMQSLAKLHVYWPKINADIIREIERCNSCQQSRQNDRNAPLHPWGISPEPWSRLHLDFAGPFEGKMWMILIDSYTHWLEIIPMKNITSISTLDALRVIFARFGLPKFLVTDNGPQLTSSEFEDFCIENGITHIKTTPYHPKSNGLAERTVRTFKERMRASSPSLDQFLRLQNFLFSYRNTVRRSTKRTPSQLMFGRHLRSRFDLLKPDVTKNMELEQINQKRNHDLTAVSQQYFAEGDTVWVNKPLEKGSLPGQVVKQTGPLSYVVNIDGISRRKHCDQMRKRISDVSPSWQNGRDEAEHTMLDIPSQDRNNGSTLTNTNLDTNIPEMCSPANFDEDTDLIRDPEVTEMKSPTPRRNPPRNRQPPTRYRE